jgi:tetratricopeptide (TPR) repeat protein
MTSEGLTVRVYPSLAKAKRQIEDDEFELAAKSLIEHLRQHPDEPEGMAQLGNVAMRLGALGQSEHFLRRALARGATDFETRRTLANVLAQQERPDKAIPLMESLIAEKRDQGLLAILGSLLERIGKSEEALAIQERMVEELPDSPPAWIAYGHGLRSAGRVDEAIAAYRRAIAVDEEYGEAWWGLASIRRQVFDEADIAAMQRALGIAVDIKHIAPLNFALARAFRDRDDHENAFRHYEEGNRLRAEIINYNAHELTDEIAETERIADAGLLAKFSTAPIGDARPVFIVSLPRSGSTLLEQMLGSHPQIEPVGELPYVPAILRTWMELATRRGKITVPQAIAQLTDEQAVALGKDYLQRASLHRKTDRPYFVDKLPQNWSNVLFIRRILPQAKFIHIRRPAMDCCFSNFSLSFTRFHASSFTLKDIGQCYVDHVRLMEHLDRIAPGLVHHVSYQALVDDPQRELEGVLAYLGLPWDDAVLEFHKLDRVVRTPSSEQVRRPINREGIDVWKPYSRWLDPLREVLGDLAES